MQQQPVKSMQQSSAGSLFDQQMQQSIQLQTINSTQHQQQVNSIPPSNTMQSIHQPNPVSVFDQQMQKQSVNGMQSVNSMQPPSSIFDQQMQQQSSVLHHQLEQQIQHMNSIPQSSVFDQQNGSIVFDQQQQQIATSVFDQTQSLSVFDQQQNQQLQSSIQHHLDASTPSTSLQSVFDQQLEAIHQQQQTLQPSSSVFDQHIDVSSFTQPSSDPAPPSDALPVVEEVKVHLYSGNEPPTFGGGGEGDVLMDPASLQSIIQSEAAKAAESQPPPFKKQKMEWKPADNSLLTEAVEACGLLEWESVGERLGRSAAECEAQWINIQPRKGKWEKGEDEKLVAAYRDVYESEPTPPNTAGMMFWYKVAGFIPGRSGVQCMARYNETLDPSLK